MFIDNHLCKYMYIYVTMSGIDCLDVFACLLLLLSNTVYSVCIMYIQNIIYCKVQTLHSFSQFIGLNKLSLVSMYTLIMHSNSFWPVQSTTNVQACLASKINQLFIQGNICGQHLMSYGNGVLSC